MRDGPLGCMFEQLGKAQPSTIVPTTVIAPTRALTFIPISMLERSAKGTSRVTSSQRSTAKLHMSAERLFVSSGFFCRAGGRTLICPGYLPCPVSAALHCY